MSEINLQIFSEDEKFKRLGIVPNSEFLDLLRIRNIFLGRLMKNVLPLIRHPFLPDELVSKKFKTSTPRNLAYIFCPKSSQIQAVL